MNDLFSLEGRVALVTGGSRGIGRMIAAGFLSQGAKVYISSRKAAACDATAAELSKIGPCISRSRSMSRAWKGRAGSRPKSRSANPRSTSW
jgi:NAD(P)-dependent dehydrogenase (short-subunit alcohol dehydrogenase family)